MHICREILFLYSAGIPFLQQLIHASCLDAFLLDAIWTSTSVRLGIVVATSSIGKEFWLEFFTPFVRILFRIGDLTLLGVVDVSGFGFKGQLLGIFIFKWTGFTFSFKGFNIIQSHVLYPLAHWNLRVNCLDLIRSYKTHPVYSKFTFYEISLSVLLLFVMMQTTNTSLKEFY